ncbi:hypothetical protein [Chenggangzhangella methanolivorans]|uniref:Uncharacterized protein n=1 Tax=Chenggangzhangella methanolivorans TaxID=1437009 RepID=A0A9E6R7V8_9HYPH|nr:hypothetical protein [Chenggangzhangella methanolivorans]QZN99638.1 hypothetical protein K6K41_23560 [Chenggangzhangella methanolivorans]
MTREAHDYPASVRRAVRALRRWDGESVADLKRLLLETVAAARAAGLQGYGLRARCPHDVRWALGQAQDNRRISAGCSGVWNANDCRPATVESRTRAAAPLRCAATASSSGAWSTKTRLRPEQIKVLSLAS